MKRLFIVLALFCTINCTPKAKPCVPVTGIIHKNSKGEIVPRPRFGATQPDSNHWRGRPKIVIERWGK